MRTFGDWKDPAPGFVEADLVAHCGGTLSGSFVWSLVLTDIASEWTECVPLLMREARLVVDALVHLRGALPFPLRGVDADNGSEFLNEVLVAFCREQGIELTRWRPFRKNAIPVATKDRLRAVLGTVDPLALLDEIRAVQHHLAALAAGATVHPVPDVTPTSTGSCGASRSHGAPARCGRPRRARQRAP